MPKPCGSQQTVGNSERDGNTRWEYLLINLYAGQEATVKTGHETANWFQIGKGVYQGCILSSCLVNLYTFYIMRNAGVYKAETDVFLELSCFFDDPEDVDNLISGSSAFSKTSLNTWKFMVHILRSLAWRILSITLLACEMSAIVWQFVYSLALPFFGIGMKTGLFQSCGHC